MFLELRGSGGSVVELISHQLTSSKTMSSISIRYSPCSKDMSFMIVEFFFFAKFVYGLYLSLL